ncbi:MAG: NtrZ family periplasmic regulatory protein [Brevundimonas sp.]|uniref:NtrZ family periplasmic regulatory protein n=1 Tax=Brevundimonas sp. TaxID=1871086 RepID=UPI00391D8AC2
MRFGGVIAAVAFGLALTSLAQAAQAQTSNTQRRAPAAQTTLAQAADAADQAVASTSRDRRGLRWYDPGRWGLNFNLGQPTSRTGEAGEVEAGAYYNLNRRLSVGAAAELGTREIDPARPAESDRRAQPRVRLETIFKF